MNPKPVLHPDVEIIRIDPQSYLIYDAARDRRYRCGAPERWLLEHLDRNQTRAALLEDFYQQFGRRISARELASFLRHLERLQLGVSPPRGRVEIPDPPLLQRPLSRQDPGAALNHAFDLLVVVLGWILHPLWIFPLLGVSWIALVGYVRNLDLAMAQFALLFRGSLGTTLLLLFAVRTVVTLPRELLVGMACRRYGGRIGDFGLQWWYKIVPYVHCEVADSVQDERGRWTLLSIGLWFHLALFAASALAWMMAPFPSVLSDILLLNTLLGALGFVLRLNPFDRTNMYGLLCYRLKIDALMPRALAETKSWLLLRGSPEPLSPNERFWFRVYGLGVYLTRGLLIFLLGLLLWFRFQGKGMVVFAIIVFIWQREWSKSPESR